MPGRGSGRALLTAAHVGVLTSCLATVSEPPREVWNPPVAAIRTVLPGLDRNPIRARVLARVPTIPTDPILDSRWARDPSIEERTASWIGFWTGRGRGDFERYLARMELYREVVDAEIAARGLPASLRYLPIVESGYAPAAVSSARAVGLWQFMSGTAREVGLSVSPILDERRDPVKSTPKALEVLADHRERFGSWFLALAAYNAGPARVSGILRRNARRAPPGGSLYVALRARLPRETRDFVPRFLAAAAIAGSPRRYGFERPSTAPLHFEDVSVPDATSVDVIARAAESPQELIEALNPQLVRGFTPPDTRTTVRVPAGRGATFRSNYARISPAKRITFIEHRVVSGETLGHIALHYGVEVDTLRAANPGVHPRRLQIGQWLIVPRSPRAGERRRSVG